MSTYPTHTPATIRLICADMGMGWTGAAGFHFVTTGKTNQALDSLTKEASK